MIIILLTILGTVAYFAGGTITSGLYARSLNRNQDYLNTHPKIKNYDDDAAVFFIGFLWPLFVIYLILCHGIFRLPLKLLLKLFQLCLNGNPWQSWKQSVLRRST